MTDPAAAPAAPSGGAGPAPRRGSPTSGRTIVLIFVIALGVAVLSIVGTAFYGRTSQQVSAITTGTSYTDSAATLTFVVSKRAQDAAVCTVEALDERFTLLGTQQDVQVPVGESRVTLTAVVDTPRRANIVQVQSCVRAPAPTATPTAP